MTDVHLNDVGIVCALGCGREQVAAALFAGHAGGLQWNERVLPGKKLMLGEVDHPLPALQQWPLALRGRNNALLQLALTQIQPAVDQAIARYGAGRVAVPRASARPSRRCRRAPTAGNGRPVSPTPSRKWGRRHSSCAPAVAPLARHGPCPPHVRPVPRR